ncbi:XRE family transcriptional regulator [Actinomadura craniellae]|uniref:XRE family transcriptional regulator n=1 Tax=Actinomadura craniellae TaxID=2231787 RepID=A0A365HA06_9ACTN|nr:helix-turn-helix transcriptional regulator [Actinomadura craniellae]RAY15927.1 XRE family transcriptional regulator [Actinomadura craniellae]
MSGGREGADAKRRRLAAELRRLRDLSGMSGRELSRRIGISQSKVSRIESGATLPTLPEVTAWSEAVDAPAETREWLVATTEGVFTEVRTWRTSLRNKPHLQGEVRAREAGARLSCSFQPSVVPGLLQTAEYSRRVFSLFREVPYTEEEIAAAVAGRLDRQLILYEEGKRFEFLITEAALRWRPGPARLLAAQLDRVASLSTLENVRVGLIPYRAQAVTFVSHGFVIYGGPDDDAPFVTVEAIHAKLTVNDPEDVELYRNRWSLLQQMAIFGDEARAFLTDLRAEVQAGE